MKKVLMFLCAMILIVGGGSKANALSFFSTSEFEGIFDFMGVTPFDPELGTLEEVNVSIDGILAVILLCDPDPLEIGYSAKLKQNFFSFGGRYFTFVAPAEFLFSGTNYIEGPLVVSSTIPFSYDFSFDETTDSWGYTTISSFTGASIPPPQINGLRSGFIESIFFPINEIDYQLLWEYYVLCEPTITNSEGSMVIEYVYEPAPVPEPVPEPATMLLLGSGLIGLAAFGRKFRKRFETG